MYDYKLEKNEYIMFESSYLIVEHNDIKKECAIIITNKKSLAIFVFVCYYSASNFQIALFFVETHKKPFRPKGKEDL